MPKVLIVEDDELIAKGMATHLAEAGFDPLWMGNGEAGLARLRFERPDVCVLDLMMPLLDGWKLIETARAEGIGTPIVVVSAERRPEHEEFAKEERPRVPEPSPPPSDRVQALPLEPVLSGGESPRHATPDGHPGGKDDVRRGLRLCGRRERRLRTARGRVDQRLHRRGENVGAVE